MFAECFVLQVLFANLKMMEVGINGFASTVADMLAVLLKISCLVVLVDGCAVTVWLIQSERGDVKLLPATSLVVMPFSVSALNAVSNRAGQ